MKPLPQRKSPRLQGYDYSSDGMYFVTICTYQRELMFGDVFNGEMQLSDIGELAEWHWNDLPNHFSSVELDMFVVMPNHVHGIIIITDGMDAIPTVQSKRPTLGTIVGTYKAAVTRQARRKLNFMSRIWQSSYYDHIIRKESNLSYIRRYVLYNTAKWEEDGFHPNQSD